MAKLASSRDSLSITYAAVSDVHANPWNPNKMNAFMYAKAIESIQTHGFIDPITCRDLGHFQLEIIDGEHRFKAAVDLGYGQVPVINLGKVSDTDAKKLTITLNELRGQASPAELQDLLQNLMSETSVDDLMRELPYTEDMFRALTELPPLTELPQPQPGSSPAQEPEHRWVERLYRLPLAAAAVVDDAIARAKGGDDIEDWQALERIAADFLASDS